MHARARPCPRHFSGVGARSIAGICRSVRYATATASATTAATVALAAATT